MFAAYQSFASAFFVHRGIASVADLHLKVPDLFGAKASITGRRGLVCTGFATMGAEVLARAGATLDGFSVGIHASDDMVRNDKLEEQGHAIARMTRGGTAFCVSNQLIENDEERARRQGRDRSGATRTIRCSSGTARPWTTRSTRCSRRSPPASKRWPGRRSSTEIPH